jgi:hypothetical protein
MVIETPDSGVQLLKNKELGASNLPQRTQA